MKISLIYRELYDRSYELLLSELREKYDYGILIFPDIVKFHLKDDSEIGKEARFKISKGQIISAIYFHRMLIDAISKSDKEKIALVEYPNSKEQINLFKKYYNNKNIELQNIWYFKGLNTIKNLMSHETYSMLIKKYNNKDNVVNGFLNKRSSIEQTIKNLGLNEKVIKFESEALGINYKKDEERLKKPYLTMYKRSMPSIRRPRPLYEPLCFIRTN